MQKPDPNLLKGNLDLILLEILEPAPMYGLEIINEAQSRTGGYFDFKEGSLYPALHRLEQQGLLTAEFLESTTGGPRRKYYRLSDKGNQALKHKREQWKQFNQAIEALRGGAT
jgi:PadR family transcriptional regulator, regulatory protein PadR